MVSGTGHSREWRAVAAIKEMDPSDMPSYEEMMRAALDGSGGNPGIL